MDEAEGMIRAGADSRSVMAAGGDMAAEDIMAAGDIMAEGSVMAGILAGGRSSRMGRNKAFLPWEEQTVLEHLARLLAEEGEFDELLISVSHREEYRGVAEGWQGPIPLVLVEDEQRGYGPLEGLYQLLSHGKNSWLFVTATDMPLICHKLIQGLLDQSREGVQAVIPRAAGRVQPLCGLYGKDALPALKGLRFRGEHKVRRLLEELSVRYVDMEELGLEASVLENVNTPEEYGRVLRRAENSREGEE